MQTDLTHGKITVNMLLFALPLMAGNLLQQLYNIADTWVVGRFLGADALAAVGSAAVRINPRSLFAKFQIKQKLQCHYNTGVLGGAKQPKSEPLPSGASLATISSKVMVFVPSL